MFFLQPIAHCDCEIVVVHFSLWFILDLSRLRNLEILDLSFNYFSGSFPSWVGSLTGLVQLGLGENNFDGGFASVSRSLTFFFFFLGGRGYSFFEGSMGKGLIDLLISSFRSIPRSGSKERIFPFFFFFFVLICGFLILWLMPRKEFRSPFQNPPNSAIEPKNQDPTPFFPSKFLNPFSNFPFWPLVNQSNQIMSSQTIGRRRQPLLTNQASLASCQIAEVAGGTAAECAAVCCCCPCGLMNLLYLAIYKVPSTLCRRALRRNHRKKLCWPFHSRSGLWVAKRTQREHGGRKGFCSIPPNDAVFSSFILI